MVERIGLFSDVHHGSTRTSPTVTDLDILINDKGVDPLVWGGDQCGGEGNSVPHTTESEIRSFWENVVQQVSGAPEMSYAIPGNHDVPYPWWQRIASDYIPRSRVETPIELEPVSGLKVFLINTQGPAIVQGGQDSLAQNYCYVPYNEFAWLHDKLQTAESNGDIRLVIGHAPIWFSTNSTMVSHHPNAPFGNKKYGNMVDDVAYEIVSNSQQMYDLMKSVSPVCYFSGHDYHTGAEEYRKFDGWYHTWQDHYSQNLSTTSFIEVDTSTGNVKYITVDGDGAGTENVIMDVTPTW